MKEEDLVFLRNWQLQHGVRLHVWHAFYDLSFGLAFDRVEELVAEGKIEPTVQTFQAPGGAATKKAIYKFYHHYAYTLGEMQEAPELIAAQVVDKHGHILPYVRFQSGPMALAPEAELVLTSAHNQEEL